MNYGLTEKMYYAKDSIIRSIVDVAGQELKEGERVISFAPGWPDPEALPDEEVARCSAAVLKQYGKEILQYGSYRGYAPYHQELKRFLNRRETICYDTDGLVTTFGSGQALHLAADAFISRGDIVLVEDPSYVNAINLFELLGAKVVGVPMEADGVDVKALEEAMQLRPKPKFFYTIPNFGNPSTITMSMEKRRRVYELAVRYGVVLLEDNPYGYLRFKGEELPAIKSLDRDGVVIYSGTLSKIISPGIRAGFLCCKKELSDRLQMLKDNTAPTNVNWVQYMAAEFLQTVDMEAHLKKIAAIYEAKGTLMYRTMKECFHPAVEVTEPYGGMFIWVTLPEGVFSAGFCMEAAKKLHIAIVPGEDSCVLHPERCTSMRFNFSVPTPEEIVEGIRKIGELTWRYCG